MTVPASAALFRTEHLGPLHALTISAYKCAINQYFKWLGL